MLTFESKLRRNILSMFLIAAALAGCAGQQLHNSGLKLVQEGRVEEGLAKLEQASKVAPDNLAYHKDLLRSREQTVNRLLSNATAERAAGHVDAAQSIYQRILRVDPNNQNAQMAIESLLMDKRHEALIEEARGYFDKGDLEAARATLKPIFLENPKQGQAVMLLRLIDEQQTKVQMAEPTLNGQFKKPVTLQFRDANLKMVFEALSRTSGINVLLDKDIKGDIKTSIFVKDVSVEDAIDLILMQSQLEKKVLSNNTVYIYPNTPAKIKDYQDLKIRSFHLVNADPKQMLTMIKTMLKTKDIFVHEKTNSIVMRDTPDAIHLAEKLIADQDIADPEVMLEVEVLEIDRARASDIGIQFPTQIALSPLLNTTPAAVSLASNGTVLQTTAASTSTLTLAGLHGLGAANFAVSPIPTVTLNAMLQDSDTNILSSPRLRVRNREKAKIMIGDRVPIITNSLTPTTTGPGVVTGTVTYQDVGLKLDVEPEIHLDNEVSIKIGLEVSSLGNAVTNTATGSVVYTVQTRNTSTALRLRDGETQILAGLIEDKDTSTVDKVPALGQLPILGRLFSNDNGNKSKKEIILSITPHLMGNAKMPDAREMEYWSGTESTLHSNQLVLKQLGTVTLGNSGAAPTGMSMPRNAPAPVTSTPTAEKEKLSPATKPAPQTAPAAAPQKTPADKEKASGQALGFTWQGPKQVKVGDKILVSLNSESIQGVKSLSFEVGFDPAILKALDIIEGTSMKQNNASSNFTKSIDQAGGISVELSGTGSGSPASVVTLMFEAISAGQGSPVTVNSLSAAGTSGEPYTLAVPAPYEITVSQ
jgi:general secretion pathway protein D